ncbi:hypothetical protein CEXT_803951 [Caerostris extrusa]|uniref:Uncharacterized protein n=1 Tax=Caerostris extrusa TaxID=172846 RepID=A0AAV4Y0Y3_CAEEX|nr:hypothetical protein CEXT_803951 [Caerostris extrusa]
MLMCGHFGTWKSIHLLVAISIGKCSTDIAGMLNPSSQMNWLVSSLVYSSEWSTACFLLETMDNRFNGVNVCIIYCGKSIRLENWFGIGQCGMHKNRLKKQLNEMASELE